MNKWRKMVHCVSKKETLLPPDLSIRIKVDTFFLLGFACRPCVFFTLVL